MVWLWPVGVPLCDPFFTYFSIFCKCSYWTISVNSLSFLSRQRSKYHWSSFTCCDFVKTKEFVSGIGSDFPMTLGLVPKRARKLSEQAPFCKDWEWEIESWAQLYVWSSCLSSEGRARWCKWSKRLTRGIYKYLYERVSLWILSLPYKTLSICSCRSVHWSVHLFVSQKLKN